MQTEWRPESLEIAQTIKAHAEKRGIAVYRGSLWRALRGLGLTHKKRPAGP